jgi:hypothetical protein
MRNIGWLGSLVAAVAVSGCGGAKCPDGTDPVDGECPCAEVDGYPSDFGGTCPVDTCADDQVFVDGECLYTCEDGSTVEFLDDCPVLLDPVAVGFEFEGGWNGTEITNYSVDIDGEITELLPSVLITFTDADYFSAEDAEGQIGHYCEVIALVTVTTQRGEDLDTDESIWHSFEMSLAPVPDSWTGDFDTACGDLLDEDVWGFEGETLFDKFDGIRFGLGFGPMTDYLRDAWSEESLADLGTSMVTEFIAINDADGNWVAEDWTTGVLFEMDEDGVLETTVDEDGNEVLIGVDVSGVTSTMPAGYIRSFAYWYQDFPLLDLDNLKDGAPAPVAQ